MDGWSLPTGGPAWLAYDFCLPDAADGTGWTPSATAEPGSDRIGGAALLFNGEIAMTPIRIGLDIAKNVFQVHGVDDNRTVVIRKRLRRPDILRFFASLPHWH